jgi:hypothetical protein
MGAEVHLMPVSCTIANVSRNTDDINRWVRHLCEGESSRRFEYGQLSGSQRRPVWLKIYQVKY